MAFLQSAAAASTEAAAPTSPVTITLTDKQLQAIEKRMFILEKQLESVLKWKKASAASLPADEKKQLKQQKKDKKEKTQSAVSFKADEVFSSANKPTEKQSSQSHTLTRQTSKTQTVQSPIQPAATSIPYTEEELELAGRILDVIKRYGQHLADPSAAEGDHEWKGKAMFVDKVAAQLRQGGPIQMILPAFPWKSINRTDKVLSKLPDLGEKLALARLNQLCEDIKTVYPAGGQIKLATDGLLFDDVVGISDEDTWDYSVELMRIAKVNGFYNIKLVRAMDILGLSGEEPLTKEKYLSIVDATRAAVLERYGRSEEEVRKMMEDDADTLATYRGFIRFLETDLKHSAVSKNAASGHAFRRCVKQVAIRMMIRAESFTKLLQAHCGSFVRLSIHPSSGAVKLSVPLIAQLDGAFPKTPWHSCVTFSLDGGFKTVHSMDVRDTHDLVYHEGRPFYYRERSDLWDWQDESVIMEPSYPNILTIKSANGLVNMSAEQKDKLEKLKVAFGGVIKVSGFLI